MIQMEHIEGRNCPMIWCSDVCQERIVPGQEAHTLWDMMRDEGPVFHVHRYGCDRAMDARIAATGGMCGWEPLDTHLSFLMSNAGVSLGRLQKRAVLLAV